MWFYFFTGYFVIWSAFSSTAGKKKLKNQFLALEFAILKCGNSQTSPVMIRSDLKAQRNSLWLPLTLAKFVDGLWRRWNGWVQVCSAVSTVLNCYTIQTLRMKSAVIYSFVKKKKKKSYNSISPEAEEIQVTDGFRFSLRIWIVQPRLLGLHVNTLTLCLAPCCHSEFGPVSWLILLCSDFFRMMYVTWHYINWTIPRLLWTSEFF